MTGIVKDITEAVSRQGYEVAYIFQAIPVLGAVTSIPTALVSGVKALAKLAQAVFQHFSEGKAFFRPEDGKMDAVKFPMEDAKDLGLIFASNVLNICTLGFSNCILFWTAVSQLTFDKQV